MRSKTSNLVRSVVAGVLTLTVALSSTVCTLVANAGATYDSGGVMDRGTGNSDWLISKNDKFVMRINASAITDSTSDNNLAEMTYRYGNGSNAALFNYPLFMQLGSGHLSGISYSESLGISDVLTQMATEVSNYSGDLDWRYSHRLEYLGTSGNNTAVYQGKSAGVSDSKVAVSVYLEDTIQKVRKLYDDGKISADDVKAFWYFYTRMAVAANKDAGTSLGSTNLASTLQDKIASDSGAVISTQARREKFQTGYAVALAATYWGDKTPLSIVGTSAFSTKSSDSKLWQDNYRSIVIERLWTGMGTTNTIIGTNTTTSKTENPSRNILISMRGYFNMVQYNQGINSITPMKEAAAASTVDGWYEGGCLSLWYSTMTNFYRYIIPAYTKSGSGHKAGDERLVSGKETYAGWGYFEITDGTPTEPYKPYFPTTEQIATEVTYNAFLATRENSSNWTSEIYDGYNPKSIDAFANNGHIMSDTVYISQPRTLSSVAKEYGPSQTTINSSWGYLDTSVDDHISLSAPVADTKYDLRRVQYRITDAGGRTVLVDTTGTTTNSAIAIKGSDINSAKNNSNSYYAVRDKIKITDRGVITGYYQPAGGSTQYYYIYSKDKSKQLGNTGEATVKSTVSAVKFNAGDLDESSKNYYYIKIPGRDMYPVVYENNNWYLCPVKKATNLLVQIKADYVADFGEGTTNYNNTYKTVNVGQYLLSKNNSSNDFTKKTLYSMIDNYCTGQWGTQTYKSLLYSNNESNSVTVVQEALAGSSSKVYKYTTGSTTIYTREPAGYRLGGDKVVWLTGETSISSQGVFSAIADKVGYVAQLDKQGPSFVTANDTARTTFLNSALSINIKRFSNSTVVSTTPQTRNNLYYTDINNSTVVSTIRAIGTSSDTRILRTYSGYKSGGTDEDYVDKLPRIPAEGRVIANSYLFDALSFTYFRTRANMKYRSDSDPDADDTLGYREAFFTKILATYNSYVYTTRGSALTSSKSPAVAQWAYSESNANSKAQLYNLNVALRGNKTNSVGSLSTSAGFLRFGTTTAVTTSGTRLQRVLLNNMGLPATLQKTGTDSYISKSIFSGDATAAKSRVLQAPYTQSCFDIPLSYNFKVYTASSINKTYIDSSTSSTSSTVSKSWQYKGADNNSVFLKVYPEVTMWGEKDTSSSTNHTPIYNSVVVAGEKERYVPAMTYATLSASSPSASAQVVGTAIAYDSRAKALAQRLTAGVAADSEGIQVLYSGSGLNMAFTSSAKGSVTAYALDFINSSVDIKSEWGNSNYSADAVAKASMSELLKQFESKTTHSLAIYNGTDVNTYALAGTETATLSAQSVSRTGVTYKLTIKGGYVTKVTYYNNGVEQATYAVEDLSTGTKIYAPEGSGAASAPVKEAVLSVLKNMRVVGSNNVLLGVFERGTGDKISETALKEYLRTDAYKVNGSYRYDNTSNGWYYEDCSVLCIREYTANVSSSSNNTVTEQLPLNMGPQTQTNKNAYFTNGYKGWALSEVSIVGKSGGDFGGKILGTASSKVYNLATKANEVFSASKADKYKADFIIADVTVNEATGY